MYCYKIMDMIYILHFIQRGAFVAFQTFKFTGRHSGYLPELGTQMSDTRILKLCGVCEYSLHELCFMVPFDLCRFRSRKQNLPQCLAAIETRYFQYGYPGCQQHRYRLSIQCIQSIVPGFLVIAGDNAPFVFRGCKRYYSFYSSGPLTRRTGETKHLNGYP